jgi:DNA-binding response OmpR family regulator
MSVMKKEYDLTGVRAVLFNGTVGMRRTIRDVLHGIGFQAIEDFGDLDDARRNIPDLMPDLLILDLDHDREGVCNIVREIRQGALGGNPFPVIIMHTWQPMGGTIGSAMSAGADDIIGMPISVRLLSERIENMILNRKDFVVTASYIGPDRRASQRSSSADALGTFAVPNGLRHKATGDASAAVSDEFIRGTNQTIVEHRLQRLTNQLNGFAADLETASVTNDAVITLPKDQLEKLSELLDQITDHLEAQGTANLLELAFSMRGVMAHILESSDPTPRQLRLLTLHGQAVAATLRDDANSGDLVLNALNQASDVIECRAS